MERKLTNAIYGLKFAMEKNGSERLKSSSGTKRNYFDFLDLVVLFYILIMDEKVLILCEK